MSADDLQFFLALARARTLVSAGAALGMGHTTVGRRVTALERSLGQRLFDRTKDGWELTDSGHKLLGPAEAVDAALSDARDVMTNSAAGLTGTVRVLCPDAFGAFMFAPRVSMIRQRHPDLVIELVTATAHLEQTVRDFDVAVTLEKPTSARVLHRKLTDHVMHLYASPAYIDSHQPTGGIEDLDSDDFIYYVDRLMDVTPLKFLSDVGFTPPRIQSTNMVAHWQAAAAGNGFALLPRYVVAQLGADLYPIIPQQFHQSYYLALPREHSRLARVQAVVAMLDEIVHDKRQVLYEPDTRRHPAPAGPVDVPVHQ